MGALKHIKSGLDEQRLAHVHDARAHDREAVATNVRRQVEELSRNAALAKRIRDGEIIIVGAFYEISSGIVDFFMDADEASKLPMSVTPARGSLRKVTLPSESDEHPFVREAE